MHDQNSMPSNAEIIYRTDESSHIFTLTTQFTDHQKQDACTFLPGQFVMAYLFGVGEIALSIVSDPMAGCFFSYTIRRVGRVTNALALLQKGDYIGIRGPYGRGWPLHEAKGKDVLIITGGLGCAPSVSIIRYILNRRKDFGRLIILQGVKHSDDFIFRSQYDEWAASPNTQILLAADASGPNWIGFKGLITELIDKIEIDVNNTICMMCGPEGMMLAGVKKLLARQLNENDIYLNLERNMECAVGHCGHCQFGGKFICKDGPVFCYPEIKHLLGQKGF